MTSIQCPKCGETTTLLGAEPSGSVNCRCGRQLDGPDSVRKIGKYRIVGELGRGSFGTVYLADDELLGRRVALKVPHPEVLKNKDSRDRFLVEARAVARLQHRCIVVVWEVEEDGRHIATEYLRGRTLREELEKGPIAVERAAWIASELAEALSHAHSASIIHRDLKPSNVILTDKGEVKLIDFGLARLDRSSMTGDHAVMGTLIYMSPEQLAGETKKIREPSDQFNLGAVLYEMLCGSPPFGREGRFIAVRISQKPPLPRTLNPAISPGLEAIVMQTLERVPSDRYPTCRALAEDLRRCFKPSVLGEIASIPERRPALESGRPFEPDPSSSFGSSPSSSIGSSLSSTSGEFSRARDEALDPPALARFRPALNDLLALVVDRADSESRVGSRYQKDSSSLSRKIKGRREAEVARHASTRNRIETETSYRENAAREQLRVGLEEADGLHEEAYKRAATKARRSVADAEEKVEWSVVQEDGIREAKRAETAARFKAWRDEAAALRRRCETSRQALDALAARIPAIGLADPPRIAVAMSSRSNANLIRTRVEKIREETDALISPRRWPGLANALRASGIAVAALGLVAIVGWLGGLLAAGLVAIVLIGPGLAWVAWSRSRARASRLSSGYGRLCREIDETLSQLEAFQSRIDRVGVKLEARIERAYNRSVQQVRAKFDEFVAIVDRVRLERMEAAEGARVAARERLHAEFGTIQDQRDRLESLDREHAEALRAIDEEETKLGRAIRRRHREEFAELALRWRAGMEAIRADVGAIAAAVELRNPPWGSPAWEDWAPPSEYNSIVRIGEVRVGLDRLPHGVPENDRLMEGLPGELTWPALLRLHGRVNLLIEGPESAAGAASAALQVAAMRLVTSLPAGQVRLTIVDPIGLGGDFGPFLQLADFDESLATLRTESGQIEQGLADLVGHIRKMFRNYFRDDIRSIYEFNRIAQEVAEPIRILVVAGFPHGFSQAACDSLARIVDRGAQCGVLALISADRARQIPGDLTLAGLARNAIHLAWRSGRFVWEDDDFGSFPLVIDPPPPPALVSKVLRRVGSDAIDAQRVQIPFELVAPPREKWWAADSRAGVDVPLGKSGTSKIQSLTLGRGTSQHVIVAGRTGSGKSTLLHALITNLALNYHPDALELYLIDFKKGVEFNIYASLELPHARVIAVESEREFGVSVLKRLDEELKERGERFRQAGAQDLKGYRSIPGLPPLPRVLLIVDEFQEFFIEDDPLAAQATLLIDRLVRQGRAFGVHVLLGSQSLGGAYSLARATLGQMSVRIALQCSETDSRIILSEDNGAARLLSRSGEAIYNDANGMNDGNHFFQVVWQPEEVREDFLRRIRDFAREQGWTPRHPPVIFEGNVASVLSKNLELRAMISSDAHPLPGPDRAVTAYLGEAIEIKGPASARFRRLSGDNLLIIGQDVEMARGMMASALLSLAAQYPADGPGSARFWLLHEAVEDTSGTADLDRIWDVPPQPTTRGGRAEAAAILKTLAAIVAERTESNPPDSEDHFLFIHNISLFRMLHRPEDDYSLEARDPALPANALAAILKDGSAVGVHLIIWCDGLNNLNRAIDRQARREFGSKIALQMSAADSANLLDSNAASRLGYHRALLSDEAQGRTERFRPYALPPAEWTTWARARLRRDVG